MKKAILSISLMFIMMMTYAQNSDTLNKNLKNEISIDATYFIKNILDFNENDNEYLNSYPIGYKRFFGDKMAFNFGLGLTLFNQEENGGYNSNTDYKNKNFNINTKYGIELRNDFWKKWVFYYGVDLIFGYNYNA